MGQYYRPVSLDTMEHLNSHDYGCGMKLMEHSWIGNNFVEAVELLLIEGARWDKHKIVWAGDYADNEPVDSEWYKEERSNDKGEKISENIFSQCEDHNKLNNLIEVLPEDHHYICNYTKNLYVDKRKGTDTDPNWKIHPLPLLTCEGNGRGGGDFREEDPTELIGSWSRDKIGIRNYIPEGFTELIFNLIE